jgi:EAL domain-containing protein (putative c-di-GMP-specific phosphodiesterase class I)
MISFPLLPINKNYSPHSTSSNLLRFGSDQQWLKNIEAALLENRFCLYLREINALATLDTQRSYDILLVLITEEGQKIPAEVFQPIAERYGFGTKLNHWMIEQLIQSLSQISAQHLENYRFTIPLSSASLKDYRWLEMIDSSLTHLRIYQDSIGFELSENLALSDLVTTSELMTHLQTLGYRLTLDNCGSQMASFSYLQYLPIDYIKISEQFVRTMHEDLTDRAIVEMIHYLAQTMGLQTIAKGVDNADLLKMAMSLGVDYAQGRYLTDVQLLDLKQLR